MKTVISGVFVAACVLLAACNGATGDGSAGPENLADRVLTAGEMPPGWKAVAGLVDDSDEYGKMLCPGATDLVSSFDGHGLEAVGFAASEGGPVVVEVIAPATKDRYDQMVSAMDECSGTSWTFADEGGDEAELSMKELMAPPLGSESQAYRITGDLEGGVVVEMRVVIGAANGAVVLVMGTGTVGASDLTESTFNDIVQAASIKLAG